MNDPDETKASRLGRWPVHPFLLAVFPVLILASQNHPEFEALEIARPLVLAVLLAGALMMAARTVRPSWSVAAILASVFVLLIFSYGHVYDLIEDWVVGSVPIGRHRYLLLLWLAILLAVLFGLRRASQNLIRVLTLFLNAAALAAVAVQIAGLSAAQIRLSLSERARPSQISLTLDANASVDRPDIYYIILDGYARQDILRDLYGFDNQAFIDWLDSRGFYVADRSRANYLNTHRSLAASLNLDYLNVLLAEMEYPGSDIPYATLVCHSRARELLERLGYRTVSFETGFYATDCRDTDAYIEVGNDPSLVARLISPVVNRFESLLLETTIWRIAADYRILNNLSPPAESVYQFVRQRVRTISTTLTEIPDWPGSYFVFAHVISPHPPFIFGPSGEPLTPDYPHSLADHTDFIPKHGTRDEYISGYLGQVQNINRIVMDTVDEILAKSSSSPIVIIQSDHGPGAYFIPDSMDDTIVWERASILNAYLVPPEARAGLYPEITPVNTFRLLLNRVFGGQFELLPDASYFSPFDSEPISEDRFQAR